MLVSQGTLLLQFQLVLEETVKVSLPPVAGMLRVKGFKAREKWSP